MAIQNLWVNSNRKNTFQCWFTVANGSLKALRGFTKWCSRFIFFWEGRADGPGRWKKLVIFLRWCRRSYKLHFWGMLQVEICWYDSSRKIVYQFPFILGKKMGSHLIWYHMVSQHLLLQACFSNHCKAIRFLLISNRANVTSFRFIQASLPSVVSPYTFSQRRHLRFQTRPPGKLSEENA